MFTIRTNEHQDRMIAYLRNHKVRFTPQIKYIITRELELMCNDFKMKESIDKNDPDWLYS